MIFQYRVCLNKVIYKIIYFGLVVLVMVNISYASERESTICGWFKERLYFQLWSSAAPHPDESRIKSYKHIEKVKFTTSDNKKLNGYVHRAHRNENGKIDAKGYILVALGNAMIADQMIGELKGFTKKEFDVYVYDYRGYGTSEGKRRINAMIEDYKEIIPFLNEKYEINMLYGISLGAAIISNAIGSGVHFDRAVLDSSPSRFSSYGCPEEIDPINNLPEDSSNILVITGQIDGVLKPAMTSEFRLLAERRGATIFDGKEYAHPFMDRDPAIYQDRIKRVIDFLTGTDSY